MTSLIDQPLKSTAPILSLAILCLACRAPFAGKAVCIDDPLFLWAADQIRHSPTDFYGFQVNWYGTVQPMSQVTKNPPLWCYALALFRSVSTSEVWLHACCWLPAIALILGTWKLAALLVGTGSVCVGSDRVARPESSKGVEATCTPASESAPQTPGINVPTAAALLAMSTPVFLVCSTSLMCDVAMTAAWVWTIVFWKRGLDASSTLNLLIAGILMSATALTKYSGAGLVPLLLLYTLVRQGRPTRSLTWLVIPVVVLCGYQQLTQQIYGKGLLLDAGQYSLSTKASLSSNLLQSAVTTVIFLGGCLLPAAFVAYRLWSARYLLCLLIPAVICGCLLAISPKSYFEELARQSLAVPVSVIIQAGILAAIGVFVIVDCAGWFWRHRNADSLLLMLWIGGILLFAGGLNWTVNARSLLPLIPAVSIVITARLAEVTAASAEPSRQLRRAIIAAVVPSLALGLIITAADQEVANSARRAATVLCSNPRGVFIEGHWSFQYYAEQLGARSMNFDNIDLQPGDIVIVPQNNTNIDLPPPNFCRLADERTFDLSIPCSTMSNQLGTGFHSSAWGAVPFAFGAFPPERYWIYEVIRPIRKVKR